MLTSSVGVGMLIEYNYAENDGPHWGTLSEGEVVSPLAGICVSYQTGVLLGGLAAGTMTINVITDVAEVTTTNLFAETKKVSYLTSGHTIVLTVTGKI